MNPFLSEESSDKRQSPIDMTEDAFRETGHRLIDDIANFLSSLAKLQVTTAPNPRSLALKLPDMFPVNGMDPSPLVKETWQLLVNNSLLNGHPRFWGYITSSPAPIGIL